MTIDLAEGSSIRKSLKDFVVDNAAICGHNFTHRDYLTNFRALKKTERSIIGGIGHQKISIHGRGDIRVKLSNIKFVTLKNASYTPE